MSENSGVQEIRDRAIQSIAESRVAGRNTRHSRADNLVAIRELVNGKIHYTFGIHGVERFGEDEVLAAIAAITGCSNDPEVATGGGYISPRATVKGLEEATRAMVNTARRGGRFVVATGHPGSLLLYYIGLSRMIEQWGGELILVEEGAFVPPNFDLGYVERVAVLSDRCSLWHSHDPKAMELIIAAAGSIDLVVADHGFAGAAINAGIRTVGILDTNDPALAVAHRMGADVLLVPMDDNRPLEAYLPILDLIREFAAAMEAGVGAPLAGPSPRLEVVRSLAQTDRLIKERTGDMDALQDLVEGLAETYKDQFLQTHFDLEREEALSDDPYVALAIYRSLRDTLDRVILDKIANRRLGFTPREIDHYLGKRAS